ncbi:hypothetical protein TOC8171_15040 [Pseudomonas syringae]
MLRFLRFATVIGGLCLSASALATNVDPATYGYPLTNPFEATIASTPPDLRPDLPDDEDIDQDVYTLNLHPEREFTLPDNFWAVKKTALPPGQTGSCRTADLFDRWHRRAL